MTAYFIIISINFHKITMTFMSNFEIFKHFINFNFFPYQEYFLNLNFKIIKIRVIYFFLKPFVIVKEMFWK